MSPRLRERLGHPSVVWFVVVLALLLALPTLDVGLIGDDLPQAAFLTAQREGSSSASWWDMFVLVPGPRATNLELRHAGELPWWTDPELRVAFFRPLSVATHHLDHRLWPEQPWAMHLHSLLWYALACALAWKVARELSSSPSAAAIAALIYAASFGHLVPVGWLAHRNGLIAAVFSFATLLAHHHWRGRAEQRAGVAPLLLLACALLAGEAGLLTLAYLIAYELVIEDGPLLERLRALAPSLALIAIWRLAYDLLGYGAQGSGAYLDPLGAPLEFARALPGRLLTLLSFCVSPPFVSDAPPGLWWLTTLTMLLGLVLFVIRGHSAQARFGVLGAALACIPLAASVPFERLLVFAGFGVALAWGELVDRALDRADPSRAQRVFGSLAVVLYLGVSPWLFVREGLAMDRLGASPEQFSSRAWPGDPELSEHTVLVVHTPNTLAFEYLDEALALADESRPAGVWVLHAGIVEPEVERLDAQTLLVSSDAGWPSDRTTGFWRSPSQAPFVVGDQVETEAFTATIRAVEDGRATQVEFHFTRPLEDPSWAWLVWREGLHRRVNSRLW